MQCYVFGAGAFSCLPVLSSITVTFTGGTKRPLPLFAGQFTQVISCASVCLSERDTRTLFVKNLPYSATADDLKEVFEDAVDIRVPPGQNSSNRG